MGQEYTLWLSEKGIRYVLHPKRGGWTNINPDVCMSLTAKGQSNWIGTFISPEIDHIVREPKQGGRMPTEVYLKDGRKYRFDGERWDEE